MSKSSPHTSVRALLEGWVEEEHDEVPGGIRTLTEPGGDTPLMRNRAEKFDWLAACLPGDQETSPWYTGAGGLRAHRENPFTCKPRTWILRQLRREDLSVEERLLLEEGLRFTDD